MRNTRQQGGAVIQQLAHLGRHGVKAPRQIGQFRRPGFRQRFGQLARTHLAGCLSRTRQRHGDAAHQKQGRQQTEQGPHRNHGNRGQRHFNGITIREKPGAQIMPALRDVQPNRLAAGHPTQGDLGTHATAQRRLDLLAKCKMRRVHRCTDINRSQTQTVAARQLVFEGFTRFGRQFHPGLRRQHDQPGQIVGRTLCHRNDQGAANHPERRHLKHDKRQRQRQRGAGKQGMGDKPHPLPCGTNK